jgi:hypothetical protein
MNLKIKLLLRSSCLGRRGTQYGIKFFNAQETICFTGWADFQDLQDSSESCKCCQS